MLGIVLSYQKNMEVFVENKLQVRVREILLQIYFDHLELNGRIQVNLLLDEMSRAIERFLMGRK